LSGAGAAEQARCLCRAAICLAEDGSEQAAKTVRWLYERYLQFKSVRALVDEATSHGHAGLTTVRKNGSSVTTRPFGRGNLYHLLANPVYVGSIRHKDRIYDGEHEAIIDHQTFDEVQRLLKAQTPA